MLLLSLHIVDINSIYIFNRILKNKKNKVYLINLKTKSLKNLVLFGFIKKLEENKILFI